MKCMIFILICAVTVNYYCNAWLGSISIWHDGTILDYGDEGNDPPVCSEKNEVYKVEIYENSIKKNTIWKCICFRRDGVSVEPPVEYEDPTHPENKNISYFCPLYNETNLKDCSKKNIICQRDFFSDYGEERPNETYIDYSVKYANHEIYGMSCLAAYKYPNVTTYYCAEISHPEERPQRRSCAKDEVHMVENYTREIFPNETLEVKLNTSLECACNKPGEVLLNGLLYDNYTRIVVDPDDPNNFTAYHWCPEHLIPPKRVLCRENQVHKRTYLIPYGRDKKGYAKIDSTYCNCGPTPRYPVTSVRYDFDENRMLDTNATYICQTIVCGKDHACLTYLDDGYNDTHCQCNGVCDFDRGGVNKTKLLPREWGVHKYCQFEEESYQNLSNDTEQGYQNLSNDTEQSYQNFSNDTEQGYQNLSNDTEQDYQNLSNDTEQSYQNLSNDAEQSYQNLSNDSPMVTTVATF